MPKNVLLVISYFIDAKLGKIWFYLIMMELIGGGI